MDDALRQVARDARTRIVAGSLRGTPFRDLLLTVPSRDRDAWVDEVLGIEPPPRDDARLPRGSTPYLPCGIDEVLAFVHEARLGSEDRLVDLGAGLGRALIVAHLLSGARAHGIEIQAHLVERARTTCASLRLTDISFAALDAADAPLEGTSFFLYAPFGPAVLRRVLERLEALARSTPIVVGAVDVELHGARVLVARPRRSPSLTIYDSPRR